MHASALFCVQLRWHLLGFWGGTYCPLLVNAQNNKGVNQGVEPHGDVTDVKIIAFIPQLTLEDNHFA